VRLADHRPDLQLYGDLVAGRDVILRPLVAGEMIDQARVRPDGHHLPGTVPGARNERHPGRLRRARDPSALATHEAWLVDNSLAASGASCVIDSAAPPGGGVSQGGPAPWHWVEGCSPDDR
jgi:hypothetical protein